MPLIQRSRFATLLKNLTGYRGAFSPDLGASVVPVFDIASAPPDLDEEKAWWFGVPLAFNAVAAQFSSATVKCLSGTAIVTGIQLGGQAGAQSYNIGICADLAGGVATSVVNNFLNNRGPAYAFAASQLGVVQQVNRQNAASIFASASAVSLQIALLAGSADFFFQFPLPFCIQPGWSFGIETSAVNLPLRANVFGTYLGDQQ